MKQKDMFVDPESTRKNLEHSLPYGHIETDKVEPGGGHNVGDRHKPVILENGEMPPVGKVDLGGMYRNDSVYPLYSRLASLIDTVLDACDEDGTYNPHAIEELSFQWHSGRLRAEREHGTP